ncbi:MAG TPA: CBS domain-containing protein [Pyrodictiaceae archaeon]|nr:CBS domain-containing protein [Pyrodictiaceae archaeon]
MPCWKGVGRVDPDGSLGTCTACHPRHQFSVEYARKLMIKTRSNYLIVVDEKGEIIGVITKWSMLRAIAAKGPIWKRRIHDRYFIEYVMDKNIPKIPANASVEEAAYMLVEAHAEIGVVVDENNNIIGFVTKDDIVKAYAQQYAIKTKVENLMMPGRVGIVHPHHSLHHAIKKMQVFYLDALTVYDGSKVIGVISANRLPFVAFEDAVEGIKSRRLIWVRKLVRGGPRKGRYVKVTPLLVVDATVPLPENVRVNPSDSVAKAIELMEQYNVDGVPVIDNEGVVRGIICKNDVIRDLARIVEERRKRGLPVTIIQSRQT